MAQTKLPLKPKWLLLLMAACLLLADASRTKRQAQNDRTNKQRLGAPVAGSVSAAAMASSSMVAVAGPELAASPEMDARRPPARTGRPGGPKLKPQMEEAPADVDERDEEEALPSPPRRKRPQGLRKQARPNRYEDQVDDQGEDCDYDSYEYENMFQAAIRPMRQLTEMMGSMFEQMQGFSSSGVDYRGEPDSSYAMASARSSGKDGYLKQSALVSNNGRTRGVVSETRNGRTQTRRIGDDASDE